MKENEMVFGIRAVIEAIQADKEVDKILVKRDLQGDLSKELFEVLRGREIPVQRVPAERLDRLTRKNHQGVIAFMSAVTYQSLEDIIPFVYEQGKDPFIVLLDGVTDVRNFGAIARTCECAGVEDTGVSQENLRICDNMVKIPQFGTIGSLNVSVATSILVYEVVRQRMNEQQ